MTVVTLDAFDTLIELDPPVPRLVAALEGVGRPHPSGQVAAAFMAEMGYYLSNHIRGSDPEALADLRRDCARVMADNLENPPPLDLLTEIMLASLRFRVFDDVPEGLDRLATAGCRLAVVSNWDCSLFDVLTALGLASRFEVIISSAQTGAPKPDPAPFFEALSQMDVPPGAGVIHCGDSPDADGDGARAAGLRAVIIDREGRGGSDAYPRIRQLGELTDLL